MSQNKKLLQFISEQMNKPTKPKVPRNQWQHPGEVTVVPSKHITMKGVTYPVVGVDANGVAFKMQPGNNYSFTKGPVTEYPMGGLTDKGFNYNGAWGGQFQMGGVRPSAQDGTNVKKPTVKLSPDELKMEHLKQYAQRASRKEQPIIQSRQSTPNWLRKELYEHSQDVDLKYQLLKGADLVTDIMQFGNFIPYPLAQSIAKIGNTFGAWVDGTQAALDTYDGNYGSAAINATSAFLPTVIQNPNILGGYRRSGKYSFGNRSFYNPVDKRYGRMTNKQLMGNRALLGTLGAETIYDTRQEGGNIPNAQNGPTKSSYIPLVPLQRSNAYGDIQQYYPDVSKSLKQDQLKKYVDTQRLKNASTIRPSNNQGAISKAISIIANPLTAASYLAKGQRIPDNFDKAESNIYDIATNIVNPIGSIYDVSSGIGDIRRGDYASAAANLAFGLTGLPSIPVYAKNAIKEYDPSLYDAIKHVRHSNSESYRRFKTNPEEYIESYANEKKLTKNEKGNWIEPFTGSEYTNKQIRKEIENNFSKERKLTSDKLKNLGFIGLIESGKIAAPIMTKTPGLNKIYKDLAYKVASVSGGKQRLDVNHFWDVLTKNKDEFLKYHDKYTGVDGGEELFKRNLLKLYIYGDNKEFVKSKLVPRGLDKYTKKYGDLDVYEMFSDIPSGGALDLAPEDLTTMFKGDKNNPQSFGQIIRKLKKEGFVSSPKEMQDNPIIPLDDIGGHMVYLTKNAPKQHSLVSQDIWKFTPDDYTSRWAAEHASGIPNPLDKYLVRTQSTLMDYAGKPFVLMQENPIRYMKQRNPSKNPPMIDPLEWDMDNSGSFDDYKYGGEMIKRADGSYSRRGLWDNIRANKGSGKRPTKEMLAQERKIKAQEKQFGGSIPVGSYMYENPYLMNEGGEPDGAMALGQIDAAINKLMNLRKFIQPNSDLEPWVSSKLTIMDDYADAVNDYMQYNPETQEEGLSTMKEGGGIPDRYKNMGFTKTGVKKKSNRPGKKWMVLAKKGDQYKVVHGGYKGMQDYTQHNNEQRRKNFWSRMGGKNSSKATDPFSPLYWHKRFGTWQEGGGVPAPIPIPYSREYLAALNNEYNQFYAPPRYYGKDDGYDAFHHFKSQMYPTRQQDSGSGWVTNYGDYESFTHGSKDKPPKSKPGRTYKFVDHYITDYKDNMNMPFLISEIMNTNRRNEIVPAYRREEYKKGGSTWSGNTWYKSGGYVDGDILDLSPEQAEILKAAGYEFEIIEP